MALNFADFKIAVAQDTIEIGNQVAPAGLTVCSDCGIPLQESITGNRPDQEGRYRCSDCYFDVLGDEIDAHPLAAVQPVRGA